MDNNQKIVVSVLLFFLGISLMGVNIYDNFSEAYKFNDLYMWGMGFAFIFLGTIVISGRMISSFRIQNWLNITTESNKSPEPPRELAPEILEQRKNFSSRRESVIPGHAAPAFHVLEEKMAYEVTPCSDPMTPMYMLDSNFRIIDWNPAFSTCFDRTMEGRRGLNVLEWTYFLDNYQQVLDHGVEKFADPNNLPRIDVEPIRYTSRRYGPIKGTKRAYQIPNDDANCLGWLITIDPEFEDSNRSQEYQSELFSCLRLALMWSEYALSYDIVLNHSLIYPNLIKTITGEVSPGPDPLPSDIKVLDIGAGTGNITLQLAKPDANRLVVALDNNPMMLNILRRKCKPYLRQDAQGAGVIAIKQDVSSLFGLLDDFFDVVVVNNVLYSMGDDVNVKLCLKEIYRVLKTGGEVRISEPHKQANASKVLAKIKKEIQKNSHYSEILPHYQKVEQINKFSLAPMLKKWDLSDMEKYLKDIGFTKITYSDDRIYARQSFLVCARK